MEVTSITKRQKSLSSVVKSEDNACVFLRQQGNYSPQVCPWGTNCHWKFLFECSGTPMEGDSPCLARVLSTRFLLHENVPVHRAVAVQEFLAQKNSVRAPSSAPLPWFIPLLLFSVPETEVAIERAPVPRCFKTSKQLWHWVFGPYHKKTCRGPSILCYIVPLAVSMQKGCTLNKIQIVLKSFVPVLFYHLSLIT